MGMIFNPRYFTPVIFLFGMSLASGQGLSQFQWKNRIVLLASPQDSSKELQNQLDIFLVDLEGWKERDVLIYTITNDKVLDVKGKKVELSPKDIWSKIGNLKFEGVVLVGKDGGIKSKTPFLIKSEEIFSQIDAMPMRRNEMKREKRG